MDNVFIERLWRSLKHGKLYRKTYDIVAQAKQGIGDWLAFYNQERRHSSLNRMTPDQIYFDLPSEPIATRSDYTVHCGTSPMTAFARKMA